MMPSPLKELDIYGVFVPPLLVWGLLAVCATMLLHHHLARGGFYRSNAEQQIFDLSVWIIITSLLSFLIS